ncbi:hypothetical protein MTR72_12600 [Bradyrhizobium sp. ISRA442]|uniref:hypothetical protein n=1 Tax=Bradyrhizobium sp. ISRA442 TaxID=2866197 RepID=UPI00311B3160
MQAFPVGPAATPTRTSILLALAGFADEVVGTLAHLFAYVGALALLAILGVAALGQLPDLSNDEPALKPGWSVADRSHPAFALSRLDSSEKSASYIILRHPGGGRRDVMRWTGEADGIVAELDIYRPGGEFDAGQPASAILASVMGATVPLEQAGLIDTKFGPVALFRSGGTAGETRSCLGFLKRSVDPALHISGFSCQGDTPPAQRAAIACTLNRLTLLTAGNEPKLAELFAHAELRRRPCGPTGSPDWLLGAEQAQLRGTL